MSNPPPEPVFFPASSAHSSDANLPSYSENALYPNFHEDIKQPPNYPNDEEQGQHNDIQPAPPAALSPEQLYNQNVVLINGFPENAKKRDRRNKGERRGGRFCLHYLKPTTVRKAVKNVGKGGGRDSLWSNISVIIMVLLYVVYVTCILGLCVLIIYAWASHAFSKKDG